MATQGQSGAAAANGPPGVGAGIVGPSCSNSPMTSSQQQAQSQGNNFEPLDKSSSNTLKRNPKMELCKTDLLKLLGYLEGELQARDVVIAALKSEKMKHLLSSKYRSGTVDPMTALARDTALVGGPGSSSSTQPNQIEQLCQTLEALVTKQKQIKNHMTKVLLQSELRHSSVLKELEEEKQKHEHTPEDTLHGEGISDGLEKEQTRLKKELEIEKQEKMQLEADIKKITESLEEEKKRHKQIVLLLLAERRKIIVKYLEERKRSEDLAQIINDEKVRMNTLAEGLEEESKKALLMEAEMEKQQAQFDIERSQYRQTTMLKDKKLMEQQQELDKIRAELDAIREQQTRSGGMTVVRAAGVTPPPPPAKPAGLVAMGSIRAANASPNIKGGVLGAGTPMVSSKVVQPTATVSSVPVSGPTTGIARSVTPGQALRGAVFGTSVDNVVVPTQDASAVQALQLKRPAPVPALTSAPSTAAATTMTTTGTPPAVMNTAKKPGAPLTSALGGIARGTPPPVPPNKPVVPPKKEVAAAILRRAESTIVVEQQQAIKQLIKQNTVIANTTVTQNNQPAAIVASAAGAHTVEDEAKPR